MSRIRFLAAMLFCLCVLKAVPSLAEINVGTSIDWLAVSRPQIALAEAVASSGEKQPEAKWYNRSLHFKVTKSLKGVSPSEADFEQSVPVETPQPGVAAKYLLFFGEEGKVDFAVNLAKPDTEGLFVPLAADFSVMTKGADVLALVENRLEQLKSEPDLAAYVSKASAKPRQLMLEVQPDQPAYKVLWSGSICFLIVPADKEYKDKFLAMAASENVHERAKAAWLLRNYPGADTNATLQKLLTDSGTDVINISSGNTERKLLVYPARQAAWKSMQDMGIAETPKPAGFSEEYPDSFIQ